MSSSIAIVDASGHVQRSEGGRLPIYSIAKTFIASAICQSDIDLSTPVAHWIDSDWGPHNAAITVEQLLNHSSGLTDYTSLTAYAQAIEQRQTPWSDEEYAARTLQQPLLFTPGSRFAYSNPGYWLLKRILETEHGTTWARILHDKIAGPLELANTGVVHGQFAADLPDYPAEWVWHGVITATAADVARFMASRLIDALLEQQIKVPNAYPPWKDPHYGYGLMIEPGHRYGHNGNGPRYSASCFHFIEPGLTGCVISPAPEQEVMHTLEEMIATSH